MHKKLYLWHLDIALRITDVELVVRAWEEIKRHIRDVLMCGTNIFVPHSLNLLFEATNLCLTESGA